MMNLIDFIAKNPLLTIFLGVITIIGFIFTYKSTPQKKLKLVITDNELITNKQSDFSKLKVCYAGNNVDKLTVTKITMWNKSFPPILKSDIAETEPLSILISNGDILDVSVLKGLDTANKIRIENVEKNLYYIHFEYLNPKEGGIIQVVHTSGCNSIDTSRTLIGGKIVVSKNPNKNIFHTIFLSILSSVISMIIAFLVMILEAYLELPEIVIIISAFIILIGCIAITILIEAKEFVPKNCKK